MMLRSLENLANLSPQIKWEKEPIKSGASTALLELVLRTELKNIYDFDDFANYDFVDFDNFQNIT